MFNSLPVLLKSLLLPLISRSRIDVTVSLDQLVIFFGPSRPENVGDWLRFFFFDLMQKRGENSPGLEEFVGPDEMDLSAGEDVEQESLVGVGKTNIFVARAVNEYNAIKCFNDILMYVGCNLVEKEHHNGV